jgi:hypothetical protein
MSVNKTLSNPTTQDGSTEQPSPTEQVGRGHAEGEIEVGTTEVAPPTEAREQCSKRTPMA